MVDDLRPVFVVHHNPNNGRYRYAADPDDAIASAKVLIENGEGTWVAGNCRRMIGVGDLLLFKFGGNGLQQAPGIYAAARVTRAPAKNRNGTWVLRYVPDVSVTRRLMRAPIVARDLERLVPRSFGASIQVVPPRGREIVEALLAGSAPRSEVQRPAEGITRGLLILKEPLDKILAGTKTWEIRGKATARTGSIALIESKSGNVVGTCDIVDVIGPLTLAELHRNARRTGFRPKQLPYATTYAWVISNARRLPEPVPYRHPPGAVIWVRLETSVLHRLRHAE
jgi:hypothetical protein